MMTEKSITPLEPRKFFSGIWRGAIPLYSTSTENEASQALARKLGLKCYGVTFNVD